MDDFVKLVIDGSIDRDGNIPAEVFLAKLRQFVATLYSFDRAFAGRSRRAIDLEIVDLKRVNPAIVAFKPKSQIGGHDPYASLDWTFGQLQRIRHGDAVDNRVPQDALDNVVDLARVREQRLPTIRGVSIEFRKHTIVLDAQMESHALSLRASRQIETDKIWHAGISKGSLFGELRGVMDVNGERQFFITPPSGAERVQCVFPEEMRGLMNANLFQVVRVYGFLRYDGRRPTPYLMEAEKLDGITDLGDAHFSDLRGAFRDYHDPEPSEYA